MKLCSSNTSLNQHEGPANFCAKLADSGYQKGKRHSGHTLISQGGRWRKRKKRLPNFNGRLAKDEGRRRGEDSQTAR
jgi:hypothetical protein